MRIHKTQEGGHLLMLSYYFPPTGAGGVQRSLKFAKYLSRMGPRVTVITPKPIAYLAYDQTLVQEVPPQVRVVRTDSADPARLVAILRRKRQQADAPINHSEIGTGRGVPGARLYQLFKRWFALPDPEVLWVPFAYWAAAREIALHGITVVYTTSPPSSSHLAGYLLKRRFGLPWVADFRDFWADHFDFTRRGRHIRIFINGMERAVFNHADRIICNTPGMMQCFAAKYPYAQKKLRLIPNGYDEEDFADLVPHKEISAHRKLVHMGTLRGDRSLVGVMEAIAQANAGLPSASQWGLEQLGSYHGYKAVELKMRGLMQYADFTGNLSHRDALARAMSADALLLLVSPGEGAGLVPAKLYEYLRLGRPIIAVAPPGDAANLAVRLAQAAVFAPDDTTGLAASLKSMILKIPQTNKMELAHYERSNLARDLLGVIDEISNP
jgi:glycosyltransferase involved in cell wall biosynthesis